ncbi:hypothetical protein CDD83_10570 [Cordyceps sp. RAO-2017]|nr:hypothetical protein CDD83_10570 [Cordyceps sp. RAO-2017]
MGCINNRRKQTHEFADVQWDYINLADFKSKGCGPGFVYGYLWFSLFISIAVYAVDSFTAVNLLAFNRWSSKIEPTIPFEVSKWIFSGCIIASFVNLGFEGIRAWRVMKRGNVAECYMDSLAARWESIRVGSQAWRRFLVFTELTKSKKGAEYVALFTYFSFQSWIRVLLCSGPRQVVNALTLRSVYEAKLNPTSDSVEGSIRGFFDKIKTLATEDYQQAVILSGMCFTFVVWVFSALFLLAAVLFYVFFLFHWIPRADGGLIGYCARKVNQRLTKIVTIKVSRALARGQAKRDKIDGWNPKLAEKSGLEPGFAKPTIPNMSDDSLPEMPSLSRTGTGGTLPLYSSRPGTPNSVELGAMHQQRPVPPRSGGPGSGVAFSPRAPLVGGAAHMGYTGPSDALPYPDMASQRPGTASSGRSFGSQPSHGSQASYGSRAAFGRLPPLAIPHDTYTPEGRSSPAPSAISHRTGYPTGAAWPSQAMALEQQYRQPLRNMTGPPPRSVPQYSPQRNMTATSAPGSRVPPFGYDGYDLEKQGRHGY